MAEPEIQTVETGDDYVHVRFRDPDEFAEIRTPDWAERAAGSVSEGAEVRTGRRVGSDEWDIQSVLIDDPVDEETARELALEIHRKVES